jgi:hypothetical protein
MVDFYAVVFIGIFSGVCVEEDYLCGGDFFKVGLA